MTDWHWRRRKGKTPRLGEGGPERGMIVKPSAWKKG